MIFKILRVNFYYWRKRKFESNLLKKIRKFSEELDSGSELEKVSTYILNNGLTVFPYSFFNSYLEFELEVVNEEGFHYVNHNKNKMFFPSSWSREKIRKYYLGLLAEQDNRSPHLYCSNDFSVEKGDTLIDIGAAEGFFSLDFVSKVDRVYLFEYKHLWNEPLLKTFAPFNDKVKIIRKFVGNKNSELFVRLDDWSELYNKSLFIKIDVDGNEWDVLMGMQKLLKSNQRVKLAICTYHKHNDFDVFSGFLSSLGFELSSSDGYMLYIFDKVQKKPYFRKGVLRASKFIKS